MFHKYFNGNYEVLIDDRNGTKIRLTDDDEFLPEFPESIDLCIGRRCDGGCQFCYEGATPDGPEGDLLGAKFLDSLRPYTEIAINGNSVNHPQLVPFLKKLKEKNVFTSMTVNQIHFERNEELIAGLVDKKLIYGLGISLRDPSAEFIEKVKSFPNAVIHVINGICTPIDYARLAHNDLKLLILGYKDKGRGHDYLEQERDFVEDNQYWIKANLGKIINSDWFKLISFDNLSLEQLDVRKIMPEEKWKEFYMGNDGSFTFYIDLVDGTFGKSSLVPKSEMMPLLDDVADMLGVVRSLA